MALPIHSISASLSLFACDGDKLFFRYSYPQLYVSLCFLHLLSLIFFSETFMVLVLLRNHSRIIINHTKCRIPDGNREISYRPLENSSQSRIRRRDLALALLGLTSVSRILPFSGMLNLHQELYCRIISTEFTFFLGKLFLGKLSMLLTL